MMLALILIAVVATNLAVAVMFVTMRRHMRVAEGSIDEAYAAEMEALVAELRAQVEEADAELARQKAQLHRMLLDVERRQAAVPATAPAPAPTPPVTRRDVVRLAGEGLSFRAIAGRTGLSIEEVRLMLAMEEAA